MHGSLVGKTVVFFLIPLDCVDNAINLRCICDQINLPNVFIDVFWKLTTRPYFQTLVVSALNAQIILPSVLLAWAFDRHFAIWFRFERAIFPSEAIAFKGGRRDAILFLHSTFYTCIGFFHIGTIIFDLIYPR